MDVLWNRWFIRFCDYGTAQNIHRFKSMRSSHTASVSACRTESSALWPRLPATWLPGGDGEIRGCKHLKTHSTHTHWFESGKDWRAESEVIVVARREEQNTALFYVGESSSSCASLVENVQCVCLLKFFTPSLQTWHRPLINCCW